MSIEPTNSAAWWTLAALAGAAMAAMAVLLVAAFVARLLRHRIAAATFVRRARWPAALLAAASSLRVAAAASTHTGSARTVVLQVAGLLIVAAATWLVLRGVHVTGDLLAHRFNVATPDNRRARTARTQIVVTERVITVVVLVLGVMVALRSLPWARDIGTGLLASASIVGAVLGFTGRSTIGNLIAGVQMAFSDLLRFDDAIVVEDEWGRVEEITLTYVVVRLWDERRLVLPTSYFVDNPFENWTRYSAAILGPVELWVDYTTDIGAMREELDRIVRSSPWWDGRTAVLHVTDAAPQGLEVRALVSAPDSSSAWELRCEVREKLAAWLVPREAAPPALRLTTAVAAGR